MGDDDWVKVARVEDSVVAELLLRLKGVNTTAPPPMASTSKQALLFEWRVRQRRSRAVTVQPKNQASRDSPSTPLSFSGGGGATSVSGGGGEIGSGRGGASGSGGGGGLDCGPDEESTALSVPESVPKSSDMSRSKVVRSNESNSIRRSKKKKLQTLAELKSEDELLARERRQLQEELESVRDKLEKERVRNDNFKRIKLQQMASFNPAPITSQPIVSGDAILLQHSSSVTGCSEAKKEESVSAFVLPDLNLPLEEDSNSLCQHQ